MQRVVPGSVMSGTATPVACWPDVGRHDGPGGFEVRVRPLDLEVLVEDPQQAPEVGVAPFAAGALALLDDRVDGPLCRRQVGDRDELRPAEVLLGRLGVRRADEQALGAKPLGEVLEAGLDRPVELADRVELLQVRDDLVAPRRGAARRPARSPRSPRRPRRPCPRAARGTRSGGARPRRRAAARSGRRPDSCRRASGSSGGRGAAPRRRPSAGSGRARGGASPARRCSAASCASAGPRRASPPTAPRRRAA